MHRRPAAALLRAGARRSSGSYSFGCARRLLGGGRLFSSSSAGGREGAEEGTEWRSERKQPNGFKRRSVGSRAGWDSFGNDDRAARSRNRGGKAQPNRKRSFEGRGEWREPPPEGANWKWKNGKKWYEPKPKRQFDPPEGYEYVYGVNSVVNALGSDRRAEMPKLFVRESSSFTQKKDKHAYDQILKAAETRGVEIVHVPKHDLNMMTDNRPHQDFVLTASPLVAESIPNSEAIVPPKSGKPTLWLALDEVSDPQNLGALLRTATFLGVSGVVLSEKNCAPLSPVVSKASSGAVEIMDVHSTPSMLKFLKNAQDEGWKVVGAAVGKNTLPLEKLMDEGGMEDSSIILVLGSEGRGLRPVIKQLCDALVVIEGADRKGNVDSLNVSASGAVLLYTISSFQKQKAQASKPAETE